MYRLLIAATGKGKVSRVLLEPCNYFQYDCQQLTKGVFGRPFLIQAAKDVAGFTLVGSEDERARVQYFARLWFVDDNREVGSFLWICDELELEPSWIRRKMFALINSDQVRRDGAGRCSLSRLQRMFSKSDEYTLNSVPDLLSAW